MFKYPNTVEAAKRAAVSQWALGDALLKDIPMGNDSANTGASYQIEEAVKEIFAETGEEYETKTLQIYRWASHQFPPTIRIVSVSHRVHIACGTPEMLNRVLEAWRSDPAIQTNKNARQRKQKFELPLHDCNLILSTIRQDRVSRAVDAAVASDPKLAAKRETAQKELDRANTRLDAAKDKVARHNANPQLRRQAVSERVTAEKVQREAQRAVDNVIVPDRDPNYVPEPEAMPRLVFLTRLRHKADRAAELAREALDEMPDLGNYDLDNNNIAVLAEAIGTAINEWQRALTALNRQSEQAGVRPRSHLAAV